MEASFVVRCGPTANPALCTPVEMVIGNVLKVVNSMMVLLLLLLLDENEQNMILK